MIAALFVQRGGVYFDAGLQVDPWDEERDARKYSGPYPVIAHPPCARWGRYWSGGPSAHGRFRLGDDAGCFEAALNSVRRYGGVIEHPEASHAFKKFNLPRPSRLGGWTDPDEFGGRSCCVAQGKYGHRSQKLTWLYGVGISFRELKWGLTPGMVRMDEGLSKEQRARRVKTGMCQRLSKKERAATPREFRDLLIELVENKL